MVTLYRAEHNPFTTARHKVAPRFGPGSPTTARDFTVIGPSNWGERCYCPAHSTPSSKAISISNASANIRSAASTTQSRSPRQRSSTERQVEPWLAISTGVCAIFIDDLTLVASVLIMFLPARTVFETSWANGRMATTPTILHADLDAFYASVEQLLDPSLRGRPIAVGGGVVLAASYEAKAFGVRGGMAGRQAYELCPQIIFVSGHFKEYQRLGDAAIEVIGDFTPLVERISIDEAFADVAGCTHLFGPPAEIAKAIRQRVRAELGLPISVGVARTKHLAKIASQVAKPDGLLIIDPETELEFLHRLPVELMWGVGPVTKARLAKIGVLTIGQLAKTPGWSLERLLGPAAGEKLAALAWNRDRREIKVRRRARSAGAQSAIGRKPAEEQVFRPTLLHLADRIGSRLRAKSRLGRTVTVRVRFANLKSVTRSVTLGAPISATMILAEIAEDLVRAALAEHPDEKTISLLAISVSHLEQHWNLELELPLGLQDERRCPGTKIGMARWAADRAVDKIRDRFGWDAIGYGSVTLGTPRSVPDEFRELAEKDL